MTWPDGPRAAFERALCGDAPGALRLGRYELIEALGAGGTGLVYKAFDPALDRTVAVKLHGVGRDPPSRTPAAQARLRREAAAMAQLSHPNVVPVFDVGVYRLDHRAARWVGAVPPMGVFVVMELVHGVELSAWVARGRTWREIVDAFISIGRGLCAAHELGIVHRDVKPRNVMVDHSGRAHVLDFGLACGRDAVLSTERESMETTSIEHWPLQPAALTHTGAVLGTPRYMAPEQHRGDRADARADQYGFCVSLYEALAGRPPFDGATVTAIAVAKVRPPPPLPRHVPARLRRLVRRGLARDPAARFGSMAEVVARLEAVRRPRRRRSIAAAAVMIASLLGLGGFLRGPEPSAAVIDDPREEVSTTVLEGDLAVLAAYAEGADYKKGIPLAVAIIEEAALLELDAIRARALKHLASLHSAAGRPDEARAVLEEAALLAEGCGEATLAAEILLMATYDAVGPLGDIEKANRTLRRAESMLARRGATDERVRYELAFATAIVGWREGDLLRATEALEERPELGIEVLGAARLIGAFEVECLIRQAAGHYERAATACRRGLSLAETAFGPDHPVAAAFLDKLARVDVGRDRPGDAARHFERALQIHVDVGAPAYRLARIEAELAGALLDLGETQRALKIANAAVERVEADASPEIGAQALEALGRVQSELGVYAAAAVAFDRALDLRRRLSGGEHPDAAAAHAGLGRALKRLGRPAEAEHHFNAAERVAGRDDIAARALLSEVVVERAYASLEVGDAGTAAILFGRALDLDPPRMVVARARLGLAEALTGSDPARAEREAASARRILKELGAQGWLAEKGVAPR